MIKKDNAKLRKLWLATALTVGLTATPVAANAATVNQTKNPADDNERKNVIVNKEATAENMPMAVGHDAASDSDATAAIAAAAKAKNDVLEKKENAEAAKAELEQAQAYQNELQELYDQAIRAEETAQAEYDKIVAANKSVDKALAAAEKELADAQDKVDAAENGMNEAEVEYDEAKAALETAKAAHDNAVLEFETAEQNLEVAENAVSAAETELANIEDELAKYSEDSEEYIAAAEKLESAETALNEAYERAVNMEAELSAKKELMDQAQQEYNAVAENAAYYEALVKDADNAAGELATAESLKKDAAENKAKAEEQASASEVKLETAEAALAEAQARTSAAKAELDAASTALNVTEEKYVESREAAKKAVAVAEAAYENAGMEYVISRCLKYKDANGEKIDSFTLWMNMMKKNEDLAPYINETFEKTVKEQLSVENLKMQMTFIDESNELRNAEGVGTLAVDYDLMLMSAISNAISSQAGYSEGHLFVNKVLNDLELRPLLLNACGGLFAENLAFGYADPYDGWYDKEKALYDAGERENGKVGHYLNIKNDNYNITGFAMSADKTAEQSFGYCEGAKLTTGEFLARLYEYSTGAKADLDAAKDKLKSLTNDELLKVQAEFDEKHKQYKEAVSAAEDADMEVVKARENLTRAQAEVKAVNSMYRKAVTECDDKKNMYDKAKEAVKSFADSKNIDIKSAYSDLEKAQQDFEEASENLEYVKGILELKSDAADKATAELEAIQSKAAILAETAAVAELKLSEAESVRDEAQSLYDHNKEIVEDTEADWKVVADELTAAESEYIKAQEQLIETKESLADAVSKYNAVKGRYVDVSDIQDELAGIRGEVDTARIDLEIAIGETNAAKRKYEKAKKLYIAALADYTIAKSERPDAEKVPLEKSGKPSQKPDSAVKNEQDGSPQTSDDFDPVAGMVAMLGAAAVGSAALRRKRQ